MTQETYAVFLGTIFRLIDLAIASIVTAAILRKATEWASGFRPTFQRAYVATLVPAVIAFNPAILIAALVGDSLDFEGRIEVIVFLCVSLVANPLAYAYILRRPWGSRLGIREAILVWFYQLLLTFLIVGSLVLVATVIGLLQ